VKTFYALAVTNMAMMQNFQVIWDGFNTVGIMPINGSMDFVLIHYGPTSFFPQPVVEVF
jgi:hypothetical protein